MGAGVTRVAALVACPASALTQPSPLCTAWLVTGTQEHKIQTLQLVLKETLTFNLQMNCNGYKNI